MNPEKIMRATILGSVLCLVGSVIGLASSPITRSVYQDQQPVAYVSTRSVGTDVTMVVATVAGIYLGIKGANDKVMQKRFDTMGSRFNEMCDRLDKSEDREREVQAHLEEAQRERDELKKLLSKQEARFEQRLAEERAKREEAERLACPFPGEDAAMCADSDTPKPVEPGETFGGS